MRIPLAVAAGGAVGAAARYLVVTQAGLWLGGGLLLGTLAVNAVGSLLMGIFIEVSALVWSPSPEMRAALAVGVLGGFTTFSAFSMEVIALVEQGAPLQAALYVAASVILSLAGVFGGMRLFRIVLA